MDYKTNSNEIVIFENQKVKLEVNIKDETVWLNTKQIAELFKRDYKTIRKHINNALKEELSNEVVVAKIATTAKDGKIYQVDYYNLDMIISVGYRVNSKGGIVFRKWANKVLKEYLLKGYAANQKKLYSFAKVHPLDAQLTMSHYRILFSIKDDNKINYYINQCIKLNLSRNELRQKIKSNEYERLPEDTRLQLINREEPKIDDLVKNPIVIRNSNNIEVVKEKVLQKLILEDIENFMKELGNSFCFVGSEYKIKIGDNYNYIDLLLFNYEYNCFVVVEL